MKGYKLANGNYITGKEIQARNSKFKKEQKISRELFARNQELNDKIITASICSNMIKQIKDRETLIKNNIIRGEIIASLRSNNPFIYRQYLIIWDLVNSDYNQILHDLERGKVNKDDIVGAIDYINKFSENLIDEYWKDTLINS